MFCRKLYSQQSQKRSVGVVFSEYVSYICSTNKINSKREKQIAYVRNTGKITDYLEITNGHDFVEAMLIYCAQSSSSNKRRSLTDKAISGALRCAYSLSAFKKTRLYSDLTEYGRQNGFIITRE